MEHLVPDDILDSAVSAHLGGKFSIGSLWWISEQIWQSATPTVGNAWKSESRSHPGTFISESHDDGSPRTLIHAGRTPIPGHEHQDDIIIEMRPKECPMKLTKFAGKCGFIGQVRLSRLLNSELPRDTYRPANQNWLHPNSELKTLDENDRAKLIKWRKIIFTQTTKCLK